MDIPRSAATSGKHVVFIGIDGAQYDQILAYAPRLLAGFDHLESYVGGTIGGASEQPTFSGPGWSTLLTGVWANRHGVTENDASPVRQRVDSLFERIDDADIGRIASITNWPDINEGHFAREAGFLDDPAVIDRVASGLSDDRVTARVIKLIEGAAPVFTFAHLDEPDHVGHAEGFGQDYRQALRDTGALIQRILKAVETREAENPDEEWLVILSTDHGRDADGFGHGGQSDSERQSFIAANIDIDHDGVAPSTSVAATILDFLGLSTTGVRGPSLLDTAADDPFRMAALHHAFAEAAPEGRSVEPMHVLHDRFELAGADLAWP